MDMILQHYKRLNIEADNVRGVGLKVGTLEEELSLNWKSVESKSICVELKNVEYMLKKVSDEMVDFGHDYLEICTINEIYK